MCAMPYESRYEDNLTVPLKRFTCRVKIKIISTVIFSLFCIRSNGAIGLKWHILFTVTASFISSIGFCFYSNFNFYAFQN